MKIYQVTINGKQNFYGDICMHRHIHVCAYIHVETDKIAKMGRGEQAGAMLTVNFYH